MPAPILMAGNRYGVRSTDGPRRDRRGPSRLLPRASVMLPSG